MYQACTWMNVQMEKHPVVYPEKGEGGAKCHMHHLRFFLQIEIFQDNFLLYYYECSKLIK